MSIFRSEPMVHKRIRIPKENAVDIMNNLGTLENSIEFIDLNKDNFEAKKNYQSLINRTEELEMKITNFEKLAEMNGFQLKKYKEYSHFLIDLEEDMKQRGMKQRNDEYLDYVENEILEDEKTILEQRLVFDKTKEHYESLRDKFNVYKKAKQLSANIAFESLAMRGGDSIREVKEVDTEYEEDGNAIQTNLKSISGIMKTEDVMRLKKMVFRVSRGRAIPTFFDLDEDENGPEAYQKKIFNIFFQGGVENVLLSKLLKICDLFNCSRFNISSPDRVAAELESISSEIQVKRKLIIEAETSIREFIELKSGMNRLASKYDLYKIFLKQKKLIFINLNKCHVRDNFIDGEVWIPEAKFNLIQIKMREMVDNNVVETAANFFDSPSSNLIHPTFIRTNEFFWAFQEIVNTYGVPRYREINPTFFNIVTFPFLFGVMFGDIGHGFALLCFAIYLCLNNESLKTDASYKFLCKARYLLLGMGFFSFFCGLIYNDFLSIPLQLFNTCYEITDKNTGATRKIPGCDYYFGLDYRWYVAHNELTYVNSLKMKTSVIFGVTQMIFGIVLKCLNSVHFGNSLDLFLEGIPQFLFMSFLFGYMNVLIFLKWNTDWTNAISSGLGAPSIITQMMNFIIGLGKVDFKIWGSGNEQQIFHYLVLCVVIIMVPIMLIPKPIITYLRIKGSSHFNKFGEEKQLARYEENSQNELLIDGNGEHEEGFGELFIHQAIETIEFVLGSVSNTASYLRLWALSLAHGQLSKVIYDKALGSFITDGNFFFVFVGYFFFVNATFGILLCMDLMECFLHTLRLHWVEFQNKFYKADGYSFIPFSFKQLVEREDD